MRLILNGINGHYLQYITVNDAAETEQVLAAVAYANRAELLFDWCWSHEIPLTYYGRLDDTVAVSSPILKKFLDRRSPRFVCHLVEHLHAKVIWWRGVGVYIGSANLTASAWGKNIEAGCFFGEEEINGEMEADLGALFATLHANATPLTEEVYRAMARRAMDVAAAKPDPKVFLGNPAFVRWSGLVGTDAGSAGERRRQSFLREWHSTLQDLRNIGKRVANDRNRPAWIRKSAPEGAQADQFLHAHYYQQTFDGRKSNYASLYEL
ncbi:MAG: phospholipase D family protein, partial [Rhodospirillaceae bacterium]|nr:phospholipase D family protein [Rhodospirillaceae bacterium]